MKYPLYVGILVSLMLLAAGAEAEFSYLTDFTNAYPSANNTRIDTCQICHVNANPNVSSTRNSYGIAWSNAGGSFSAIEDDDSDGDTFSNLTEINALTFPGNFDDKPTVPEGEGEPVIEGEGEVPVEGEGEIPAEGEGEAPAEGEGEPVIEGEGEVPAEGEGEVPAEGEGEVPAEGEGEIPAEGEEEGPGCCKSTGKDVVPKALMERVLSDWLLIGLALSTLASAAVLQK